MTAEDRNEVRQAPTGTAERGWGGRALSDLLCEIAADDRRVRISVGDLAEALRDHALGALMFILAAPNILPSPPGTSIIVGPPLMLLSAHLLLRKPLRLPAAVASHSMSRARFGGWVARLTPWLRRTERMLRPRLAFAVDPPVDRVVGALGLILSGILFLPIPLGNVLPALAICLMSLGLVERDGLWVLAGVAAAVGSITLVGGVLYGLARIVLFVVGHPFAA